MKNKKIQLKYILPPLIYLLFIVFVSIISQKFPFGNGTWYFSDFHHQYQAYIIEFREKILSLNGFKEFFFSETTPMGSNYWTEFAYYASSPLNLLMIMIPKALLNYAINFLLIFKLMLIPTCFNYYINKKYKLTTINAVILTSCYSLSSFFIINLWNILWLECFAFFPLIIYFLEKGIKENKWGLYTLFLFLSIWCNFYISFIICIGITFYFLILVKYDKTFFKTFLNFAFHSVIAALLNSVLLIPLILELSGEISNGFPGFKIYTNFLDILSYHFPLGNALFITSDLSNAKLYIGILPLFLLVSYFLKKDINKKEKILSGCFLLFMLISFNTEPLNYIWHIMHHPEGITNRFVFVYFFMIIDISGKILDNQNTIKISNKQLIIQIIISILIIALSNTEKMCIEITSFFFILYAIYIFLLNYSNENNEKKIKRINIIICLILLTELIFCSIIFCLGFKSVSIKEADTKNLTSFIDNNLNYNSENDFYRIDIKRNMSDKLEFKETTSMNIEKIVNIPSISGFSSIINKNTKKIKQPLGLAVSSITTKDDGINPISGNLLSIKNLLKENKNNSLVSINDMFSLKTENENYQLLENKYFIDPIIKIKSDINEEPDNNPFLNLNNIMKSFTNINKDIFEIINLEHTTSINKEKSTEDVYAKHYEYIVEISLKDVDNLYLMLPYIKNSNLQLIYKNDEIFHGEYTYGFLSTLQIGKVSSNDKLKIVYFIPDEEEPDLRQFFTHFANFNEEIYKEFYNELNKNSLKMQLNKNQITFETNSETDGLYYIPMAYHKGWKAYINNKETNITPVLYNAIIGLNIPAGKNNIVIEFTPPGLYLGATISLLSLLLISIIYLIKLKKRKISINA